MVESLEQQLAKINMPPPSLMTMPRSDGCDSLDCARLGDTSPFMFDETISSISENATSTSDMIPYKFPFCTNAIVLTTQAVRYGYYFGGDGKELMVRCASLQSDFQEHLFMLMHMHPSQVECSELVHCETYWNVHFLPLFHSFVLYGRWLWSTKPKNGRLKRSCSELARQIVEMCTTVI